MAPPRSPLSVGTGPARSEPWVALSPRAYTLELCFLCVGQPRIHVLTASLPCRLTYDAAITKASKTYKKDKEQKEAEQELAAAKERYEEVSEDVQARMLSIQENEVQQWHDLTAFLDTQVKYASEALAIMQELKSSWISETSIKRLPPAKPSTGPHSFPSRSNSVKRERPRKDSNAKRAADDGSDSDVPSPKSAKGQTKSDTPRPIGTLSRRGSAAAEKDAAKDKEPVGRRLGMAGRAMSAVTSVASIGRAGPKTAERDREAERKFADLHSDEEDGVESGPERNGRPSSRSSSTRTLSKRSPGPRTAPLPPSQPKIQPAASLATRKTCRALFDYSPSAGDELPFSVGDEIVVLSEVADEWWQGEIVAGSSVGRKGLFPVSYVEVTKKPVVPPRPPLPGRGSSSLGSVSGGSNSASGSAASLGASRTSLHEKAARAIRDEPPPTPSDFEDEGMGGVFGDTRYAVRSPTSPTIPVAGGVGAGVGPTPAAALETSEDESDDGGRPLVRSVPSSGSLRSKSNAPSTPGKKAPPPPPPSCKSTGGVGGSGAVAPGHTMRSLSVGSLGSVLKGASPFGDRGGGANEKVDTHDCAECGCDEFEQNKFKPKGYCNACFHVHPLA